MNTYDSPQITDFGSLEELTAICNSPGGGDISYPGSLAHTTFLASPKCSSD